MTTLSNKYYLQALDAYPYELAEAMESLNYAIGSNNDNAAAHCLLGQLYMYYQNDYAKAEYHYEQALVSDLEYVITYEHYSLLLIHLNEYEKALKLISHANKLRGVNYPLMISREALVYEKQQKLLKAKTLLEQAYKESCHNEQREFLKNELERVKSKAPKKKKGEKKN